MSGLSKEQQQLLELLRVAYQHIYALEEALGLRVGQKDTRMRVDYFYDAARALTDEALPLNYRQQRLSVEWLAFDAVAIRYIEHRPMAKLKPNDQHYSASVKLIKVDSDVPSASRKPTREDKRELKHQYLRFGVMFVALFKPFADQDHHDKREEMSETLSLLGELEKRLERLGLGEISIDEVRELLNMVEDAKLKAKLEALLADERFKDPQAMKAALTTIRYALEAEDKDYKEMEDAHMQFLSAQLGLYEQGKTMVKELASQGLNVAGTHLDHTLSQEAGLGLER